jgi:hypothetical protein
MMSSQHVHDFTWPPILASVQGILPLATPNVDCLELMPVLLKLFPSL